MKIKIITIIIILLIATIPVSTAKTNSTPQATYFWIKGDVSYYDWHNGTVINYKQGSNITYKTNGALNLSPRVMTNAKHHKTALIFYELYNSNNTLILSWHFLRHYLHESFTIPAYLPADTYRLRLTYHGDEREGLLPYYTDITIITTDP